MAAPRLYYMPRTRSSRVLWLLEDIGAPYDLTEITGAQRRSDEHLRRHPLGRVSALQLGDGTTMFESAAICLQRDLGEEVIESPAHDRFAEAAGAMQSALAERDWLVDDRFSVADVMCASVLQGANARELLRPWPRLEAYVQRGEARPAYTRTECDLGRSRSAGKRDRQSPGPTSLLVAKLETREAALGAGARWLAPAPRLDRVRSLSAGQGLEPQEVALGGAHPSQVGAANPPFPGAGLRCGKLSARDPPADRDRGHLQLSRELVGRRNREQRRSSELALATLRLGSVNHPR